MKTAARRHIQDRKKYRTASSPIKLRGEIPRDKLCQQASRTNSVVPLIVVTNVDGKQAKQDSW